MKRNLMVGTLVLLAGSLLAADSSPKDDVTAAARKLADKSNYSWRTTLDLGPNAPFTPPPTDGKTEKDGYTWLSVTFNDAASIGVMKGSKIAVKSDDGWQTAEEVTAAGGGGGGGFNPAVGMARRLQNFKAPAAEVEDLVAKVKELKKDGDSFSGELTEDGARSLLVFRFGGRQGAPPPSATNAKGSVKFWIKDGMLTKYESKASGKREINGEPTDVERTSTVEIKDIGSTKLEVPDDAKKKLM